MSIEREKSSLGATLALGSQLLGYSVATAPSISICVAARDQKEQWHSSTMGTAVPRTWWHHRYHSPQGGLTCKQILQDG